MSAWPHVVPDDDLIEHETTDECPCGPTPEFVDLGDGDGWVYVHHSLDGREAGE